MNKIKSIFNKLTAYHHFLVFLIILTLLKIVNVFITKGGAEGLHFALLGVGLIVISTVLHFAFSYLFDKNKKYLHSLISTFLIILMLSHADPEPVRGVLVILLLYVAKFLIKYKGQNIFNPVVFTIGVITLLALVIPPLGVPPMDFTGIDIRFPIMGKSIPLSIVPISLALIFNVARVKRHALALSFIITSLLLGFFIGVYDGDYFSYLIIIGFIGTAVIVEPKTSPIKKNIQIIYGAMMALLIVALGKLNVPNAIVIALLFGNIIFFVFGNSKKIRTI
ncbi:MAG: hypothetical protein ACJA1C_002521 [Crocinitomicaceae bacterium]|jgi:hypothetical protein